MNFIVAAQTCCPNGVYTDNISLACSASDPTYGNGQCYNQFEISCGQEFVGGATNVAGLNPDQGLGG
jgi:hypothetical protein